MVLHSPDLPDQRRRPGLKKPLHLGCTRCTSSPGPAIPAWACVLACVQYRPKLFLTKYIWGYPPTPKRKNFVQTDILAITDDPLCGLTWHYVFPVYGNMTVPIRTLVLMISPQGVKQVTDYVFRAVMSGVEGKVLPLNSSSNQYVWTAWTSIITKYNIV